MSTTPTTPPAKLTNGQPHLEVDGTREKLVQLGLAHAADALAEELSEAVKHNRPAHQVLDRLLAREVAARDERRIRTSLRLSNLPAGLTLGNFDFGFQPSIERRQIETLATGAFIREHATLLVQGPPGVGKTHLVVSPQALRRKKYFNVAYLVVDEVGMEPMSREDAGLFFRLVSYRYRRGSTALTTNKSVKDWPGILAGDEAMTAALLDRLLHKSVVLNIRGRSYRLQELEKVLK